MTQMSAYILCNTLQSNVDNVVFLEVAKICDICVKLQANASNCRSHVITLKAWPLTFDLWGHRACRWCGSPYSSPTPSLKFVGLSVLEI